MLLEGDNCAPELVQPVCPPRCGGETPPDDPIEDVPDVPDEGEMITIVTMAIMTNQNQKKMEDWLEYHLLAQLPSLFPVDD